MSIRGEPAPVVDTADPHPPQPVPDRYPPPRQPAASLPVERSASEMLAPYFRGGCPVFATNRPDLGLRVADAVNKMFATAAAALKDPPAAAIAAPYINPAGFDMIAEGISGYDKVRLLLGAEPEPSDHGLFDPTRVQTAVEELDAWIAAERDLTGFTYNDDCVSRKMVNWLRSTTDDEQPRVEVRRLANRFLHGKAFIVEHPVSPAVLVGSSNLTAAGLAVNAELNIGYPASEHCDLVQGWFDGLWDQADPYPLADIYGARFEAHDPQTVFLRMLLAVYGDVDAAAQDLDTDLGLTVFQAEGVSRLVRFIEDMGGALLADEPGLGKTYMAGEIARRYASRGRVLIVAPATVRDSVWEPWLKHQGISRRVDVMSYTEARIRYEKLAPDDTEPSPEKIDRAFGDYHLIIADEAHHLRNAGTRQHDAITEIATAGARKDMLLVTATPINNSLRDLEHLLGLFLVSDDALAAKGIASWSRKVREAIRMEDRDDAVPEGFLYDLLDQVTVRRSRQFILANPAAEGDTIKGTDGQEQQVRFPNVALRPRIGWDLATRTKLVDDLMAHLDEDLANQVDANDPKLTFARYDLSGFSRDKTERSTFGRDRAGLMRCSILKRLESSPWAITWTLHRLVGNYEWFLDELRGGRVYTVKEMHLIRCTPPPISDGDPADLEDLEDAAADAASGFDDQPGRPLSHFDIDSLRAAASQDLIVLKQLLAEAEKTTGPAAGTYAGTGARDDKARRLIERLRDIAANAGGQRDNRKVIIFTEFADTAEYLHAAVVAAVDAAINTDPLADYRGRVADPIRSAQGETDRRELTIASFAPITAGTPTSDDLYDILVTTDVLAEGVNLHQAGKVINYDLPWNPMRLVQRHGRVDRIGSTHRNVEIDVFAPAERLDAMLDLMAKIEKKLGLAHAAMGVPKTILDMPGGGQGQLFRDGPNGLEIAADILKDNDASWLNRRGSAITSMGEQWRLALTRMQNPQAVAALPAAAGSGFISSKVTVPGFVFCAEIKDGDDTHTRLASVTADPDTWNPTDVFDTSTLHCLSAADPEDAPRHIKTDVYPAVYDAWEKCRDYIVEQNARTLREAAETQPPKPMRDAIATISQSSTMGAHQKERLIRDYNTVPSRIVLNRVRSTLKHLTDAPPERAAEALRDLAERLGLTAQATRSAAPRPITSEQVRLLAWMAVKPATSKPDTPDDAAENPHQRDTPLPEIPHPTQPSDEPTADNTITKRALPPGHSDHQQRATDSARAESGPRWTLEYPNREG